MMIRLKKISTFSELPCVSKFDICLEFWNLCIFGNKSWYYERSFIVPRLIPLVGVPFVDLYLNFIFMSFEEFQAGLQLNEMVLNQFVLTEEETLAYKKFLSRFSEDFLEVWRETNARL